MSDSYKVSLPRLLADGDFEWWSAQFQAYCMGTKELRPLMLGGDLRPPDDVTIEKLESRAELESVLHSAIVMAADDGKGTRNSVMWDLVWPHKGEPTAGTGAFAALRAHYQPKKMSAAFGMFRLYQKAEVAHGEEPLMFIARKERMRAEVLAMAPLNSREHFAREMGALSKVSALMDALEASAGEKEYEYFRKEVYSDMDRGVITGAQADFDVVKASLSTTLNRLKYDCAAAQEKQQAVAFRAAVAGDKAGAGGRAGGRGRQCYNCNQFGHVSPDCPNVTVECEQCGKRGHLAEHCQKVRAIAGRPAGGRGGGQGRGVPRAVAFMVKEGVSYADALLRHAPVEGLPSEAVMAVKDGEVARAGCFATMDVFLDTCAGAHVFKDMDVMRGALVPGNPVEVANGELVDVHGVGSASVYLTASNGGVFEAQLDDVRCGDFAANLISWPRLRQKGFTLLENAEGLRHPNGLVFPLQQTPQGPKFVAMRGGPAVLGQNVYAVAGESDKAVQEKVKWHERLGHLHQGAMDTMVVDQLATGVAYSRKAQLPVCHPCRVMKSHRVPLKEGIVNVQGKRHTLPVTSHKAARQHKVFRNMHYVDVYGPVHPPALGGYKVMLGNAHAQTGVVKVDAMRRKDEVLHKLQDYNTNVMQMEALRSDNEAIFKSGPLSEWAAAEGIRLTHSAPYTPEQNAKIERMWRTLGEGACAMLYASGLPDEFWALAMDTMAYLYNRTPRASNEQGVSPLQALDGTVPHLAHLRVFGCRAYLHVPKARRSKLQPKAMVGIFVGYSRSSKAYRVWVPDGDSDVLRGRMFESRDVTFDEEWRYGQPRAPADGVLDDVAGDDGDLVEAAAVAAAAAAAPPVAGDAGGAGVPAAAAAAAAAVAADAVGGGAGDGGDAGDVTPSDGAGPDGQAYVDGAAVAGDAEAVGGSGAGAAGAAEGDAVEDGDGGGATEAGQTGATGVRRSARSNLGRPPRNWWEVDHGDGDEVDEEPAGGDTAFAVVVPVKEALAGEEQEQYMLAYEQERSSMTARGVFSLVRSSEVPGHARVLPSQVVFSKKLLADGSLDKYKARICVNGNRQRAGVDYDPGELFAPVAKFTSFRVLVALAAANGWTLRQFDVETAFLYADLEEEVYVRPPKGFEEYDEEGNALVWLLHKSLYGLRQAPRNWREVFKRFLVEEQGLRQTQRDPCVYVKVDQAARRLQGVMAVHVDDVPNGAGDEQWYAEFLRALKRRFNFKEGPLQWCLGVEVVVDETSVLLRQTQYIRDMLVKYGMEDCKPASVPLDPGSVFSTADSAKSEEEKAEMARMPYRGLVGSLLYCAVATRPDIAVAVSKLAHVMASPGPTHYRRALYVLRYLKGTMELGIKYSKREISNVLEAYTDADYAGCPDTYRSTSGYVCMLNGGPVSWMSKLQQTVAVSTTEAEYMAASFCASEVMFLRGLLEDVGFAQQGPTLLHEDNQGAVHLMKNEVLHTRAKHIHVRYHQIREFVAHKFIRVQHCRTDEMVADILTKLLPKVTFERLRTRLLGYA